MQVRMMMSYASYFVVLLSRGMLRDLSFARLLLAATASPSFGGSVMVSRRTPCNIACSNL